MFPDWFRDELPKIKVASVWLTEKRGIAMYGDEIRGVAPSELFTRADAEAALKYAWEAAALAERLLKQLFR
jgi:HEPN domain-containing protein